MTSEPATHERAMQAVHQIRALAVELNLFGAEFARANNLPFTDVRALICLLDAERSGHPATPSWLREQLGLTSASVTALVDRLEASGHVQRQRHPQDRRSILLEVTPEAVELGWSFSGVLISNAVAKIEARSDEEMDTISSFIADLRQVVEDSRSSRHLVANE
ncbi:MarR family transcriptional regulator [Rhodococcus sp. BL-253-APC-6A1W]|uniref:MarR family winged helix-turn-helix transcriptional regulator n=1 Tax=Rhodococcus sp. BL-253-APC-6A1W TaxID=2725307 RepID=UPI00146A48C6|nr:MarR family transcriptional regulator [Rhodococcus sp. BL-253-APC-6A1W]NMD94986.1 MarR family transcriptional regulator [Rhodococcus sp. BL-253-APC-6A1W]